MRCFGVVALMSAFFSLQYTKYYEAVPSHDRAVTEATMVLHVFFRSHSWPAGSRGLRCFGHTKNVTSLRPLKMEYSVPLDTTVDSGPIPTARLKTSANVGHKAALSDGTSLRIWT